MSKRAVLMMTFGSPEEITYEGVAEFFTNIRRGVRPEPHEIQTLYDNYVRIGGTPLQRITREEVDLVASALGEHASVYFANKFSRPFITDVIKEMENDIAAKTVVETPADYIPLQKANRDMERQNEFLEARIRKLDKENGQLKRQLAELQRKQDPEQERLKKIHEAVQLFSVKTEIYLKDMDKYAWLLDDLQNIPEEDFKEYVRSIKVVKSWAVSMDQKVDGLMDKVG